LWNKKQETNCEVFNIGTGKGYSVLELIKTFQEATGQQVNYSLTERRPGDIMQAYANPQKAEAILGWKAQYSLAEALSSAWEWEKRWQQEQSSNNE
jgi:UDP-glucose 4-epimerase